MERSWVLVFRLRDFSHFCMMQMTLLMGVGKNPIHIQTNTQLFSAYSIKAFGLWGWIVFYPCLAF